MEVKRVRKQIERLIYKNKLINILANAIPLNLAAGDGNPLEIVNIKNDIT